MKKILKSWLLAAALCFCVTAAAERPMLIHSHNDYCRRAPFWQAYAQGVYSIEADVFLHDGRLLVGHDVEDLSPDMTFESLYVEPIVTLFGRNGGRAWKDSDERLQLMVELKSATEPTLQAVTALLGRYPEVFDPAVNPEAVRIAVTGRVPAPEDFGKYPAYVRFDGNWETDYTPDQLERIALVSVNFRTYSQWNGKGSIIPAERVKLERSSTAPTAGASPCVSGALLRERRFTIRFTTWGSTTSTPIVRKSAPDSSTISATRISRSASAVRPSVA